MRRILIALLAAVFTALAPSAFSQTLALTFDDGLDPETEPQASAWNSRLIAGLAAESVPAMVFPALVRVGGESGRQLVRQWSDAGHPVGNHTSRHRSLGSTRLTLAEFIQDVQEADQAFRHLATWRPMLRFPYLKEGNTADKRDGMRDWMRRNGYAPAPVSIDTSDWYYDQVWRDLLARRQDDKLARLQQAYIDHLLDRARHYDALARATLGRSPAHVMLLHVNAINAASIGALAQAFRARGWRFVAPAQAFADPLYSMEPATVPAGESIVWALAKGGGAKGLRYPAEDAQYEEPALRALGMLP